MKKRCNKTHLPAGRCVFRSIVWLAVVEGMPSGVLLHSNLISFTDTFRLQNKRTVARSVKKDFWSTEHLLSMRRSSLPGGSLDNCHLRSSYHTSCLLNYVTEADLKPYPKVWNPSHPLNFGGAREEPDDCDPSSLSAARAVCDCCSVVEGAFGRGCSRAVPVSSGLVKG